MGKSFLFGLFGSHQFCVVGYFNWETSFCFDFSHVNLILSIMLFSVVPQKNV